MLFNSFSFAIFFPIVLVIYYILKSNYRNIFLLLASCVFYMAFVPKYIIILFTLITADYFLAKEINKREGVDRKILLALSIFANIGTLIFFRYFNFLNENISLLANFLHWNYTPLLLTIALPVGLSFHVFQSLSYVIEVYKKKYIPENNYITYALYVMFFPQLVAGPIERPQHLLPQLNQIHEFNFNLARRGLERMLWGFFKKMVIADQLSQIINPLYADLPKESSLLIVIAFLFAYQLFCDFSGYSDIALGSAMMLGYDLSENFNRPFSSRSFAEFWRRWHMSLSNWLRDYLYYPLALGWGKVSKVRLYYSLFITFVLIGLWHGANWTFAVFGAINGAYLVIESATEKLRKSIVSLIRLDKVPKLHQTIQTIIVFLGMCVSFIFFRSETVGKAWYFLTNIFSASIFDLSAHDIFSKLIEHSGKTVFYFLFLSIVIMEIVQYLQENRGTFYIFDSTPKVIRYSWYYFLVMGLLFFGYFGSQTFIYFQF